jgi:hypothetical protein
MSRSVYDIAHPRLKHQPNLFWKDIGEKKLKGIPDKERIHLVSSKKIGNKITYVVILLSFFIALLAFVFSQPLLRDKLTETVTLTTNNFVQKIDESVDELADQREKKQKTIAFNEGKLKEEQRIEKELSEEKLKIAELKIARLKKEKVEKELNEKKEQIETKRNETKLKEAQLKLEKEQKEQKINEGKLKEAELKIAKSKQEEEKNVEDEKKFTNKNNNKIIFKKSFSIFKNMCMNYSSYKKVNSLYKDMKKMQDDYAKGKSSAGIVSSSRNTMRIRDKKEEKKYLVIESFNRFIESLSDLKTRENSNVKKSLKDFIDNKKMSLLLEKRLKQAINDEINDLDSARGNNMNYYKKICN